MSRGALSARTERIAIYQGYFLGASVGSNAIAFTSGSSANADSIKSLTSSQSNPPLPRPKAGIAIEVIPNC